MPDARKAKTTPGPQAGAGIRSRGIVFRAVTVIASLVVALIGIEGVFRIAGVRPERYQPVSTLVWDGGAFVDRGRTAPGLIKVPSRFENLGVEMGEYVPGARFKMQYPTNPRGYFDSDRTISFTINSLGMRGPEVQEMKPPGVFRILGVGDSFTLGEGVREEDTFLRKLESSLNKTAGRPAFQVLNAGVQGYNTRDEILTLEKRWLSLQPDLVIIVFYLNDAYSDTALREKGQEFAAMLEPTGLAKERGFKLAVVIFPEFRQLEGGYPFEKIHALVRRTCDGFGIPVLDLLDTYRGDDTAALWVHRIDHHPDEIAHRMAAEAIEKFLLERNLVPRPN